MSERKVMLSVSMFISGGVAVTATDAGPNGSDLQAQLFTTLKHGQSLMSIGKQEEALEQEEMDYAVVLALTVLLDEMKLRLKQATNIETRDVAAITPAGLKS